MSVLEAFRTFQNVVNVDDEDVRNARARRDLFKSAFKAEDDVADVIPSGSLARGTHKDPIHDVDVIVIYDGDVHPQWGQPGTSATDALNHTRERTNYLLGATHGTHAHAVRLARRRNHAVKCFLDDPDDPGAFTVDATPALRRDGKLLIPESLSDDWILCDPEYLIAEVAKRHAAWNKFAGSIRMLKWWAANQDFNIKSLVMEVLALDFLPTDTNQPFALKQFFVRASYSIEGGCEVSDPAELCGPIQTDLDYEKFATSLAAARDNASRAIQSQINNDDSSAIAHWQAVFGQDFPPPPLSGTGGAPAAPATPRRVKDTPQG